MRDSQSFTLIELLILVAIIASSRIASGLCAPHGGNSVGHRIMRAINSGQASFWRRAAAGGYA